MRLRALPAIALAGLAALTAVPASAEASKDVAYWVEFQGQGTYRFAEHRDYGDLWDETEIDLAFTYRGEIDEVVFRDGSLFDKSSFDIPEGTATGTMALKEGGNRPARSGSCGVGDFDIDGPALLAEKYAADEPIPLDGEVHVYLRPFQKFTAMFASCPQLAAGTDSLQLGGPKPFPAFPDAEELRGGDHVFDLPFSIPRDIVGMGYIEQLVPEQTLSGVACPNGGSHEVLECELKVSGRLILRKGWEKEVVPNGQPQPPSTAPPGITPPRGSVAARANTPAPAPAKPGTSSTGATVKGSKASFRQSCAAACSGTAQVFAGGPGARASARPRPLATARFRLAAGTSKTVTLALSAKARRALRRAGGRIVVTTTSAGRTTKRTLRLRRPSR